MDRKKDQVKVQGKGVVEDGIKIVGRVRKAGPGLEKVKGAVKVKDEKNSLGNETYLLDL